jgi:hypothetical protein
MALEAIRIVNHENFKETRFVAVGGGARNEYTTLCSDSEHGGNGRGAAEYTALHLR